MIKMTSSQRKMFAQIQKSEEKGIRWDRLYQKYGDVASYQELMALTQQGLLKIVSVNGTEMDVSGRLPNPPKANGLYAVCTWTARDIIKRERLLDLRDYISIGIGVLGVILSIANFVLSARTSQQPSKMKGQTVSQASRVPTEWSGLGSKVENKPGDKKTNVNSKQQKIYNISNSHIAP